MESLAVRSGAIDLSDYRRDPNSIEAKVLDVVKLVDNTLPSATAIHPIFSVALRTGTVCLRETVDNKLEQGDSQQTTGKYGGSEEGKNTIPDKWTWNAIHRQWQQK